MIVYRCSDLIFATKIRSTAESLGIVTRPVNNPDALRQRLDQVDDGKSNEPVDAVLIDLEAGDDALAMIESAKRHSPGVRVLAFGPHVQTELLESARRGGADEVLPRSAFSGKLPTILKRCVGRA